MSRVTVRADRHRLPRTRDAIVVVPGIMGSELVDAQGRTLWGLRDPRWYVSAWTSGASLDALRLTEAEKAGEYGRVRAERLLRFPAFAPFLAGFEPYSALLTSIRGASYSGAVEEFAYDWRLPVSASGDRLAEFALRHLERWRGSEEEIAARRTDPEGDRPARLVLVAHSMGGLLVRQACLTPGFAEEVRASVTLGTPFMGAPQAVMMLARGGGPMLPRARLQELAAGLPGVHDLLPSYRCVYDGSQVRRLSASDVAALGGDAELASSSFAWQRATAGVGLPGHEQVVGVRQPTVQAITVETGVVKGHQFTYEPTPTGVRESQMGGDGTVPVVAARLPDRSDVPLAQSHGALASQSDAMVVVHHILTGRRRGPWLGGGELGLDVPDVVAAGRRWDVTITGADRATDIVCSVVDVQTGLQVDAPPVRAADGAVVARVQPQPTGLFRVRVDGGGTSPVQQIVMSADLATAHGGEHGHEVSGAGS